VIPVTTEIGRRAGELRAQMEGKGQTRTQADMLLAATAQRHGLTLVTRNTGDFEGCGIALLNPFV
jgi:toxin FitB